MPRAAGWDRSSAGRSRIASNGWLTTAFGIRPAGAVSTETSGFPRSNQASIHDWRAKLDLQKSGIDDVMMPVSHRVGAAFAAPSAAPVAARDKARARPANSSTFVIVVAATFALFSALASLIPDGATKPVADDLALAHLRGSLPAIGEADRP
jgi:hypothetical protein